MTVAPPRKRAPGAGRPHLPEADKKRRVHLYLSPSLAAFLEADDLPEGPDRNRTALRRKREAAEMLLRASVESRIV